ncbi:MAG: LacI family DNA-binding transcriptional regulator, partial [Candidatus Omnitrophica bacterium]|nr:LacI family DNA-binding transcriptional regulator [Candidatus Omnitrophota bacterium]
VLNNKPGVSEKRRADIKKLAEQFGYSPNILARNLVMKKQHMLGYIVSSLSNPAYIDFFHRIESSCRAQGYQVLIADSEENVKLEKQHIKAMLEHRADGLLIFPVADDHSSAGHRHFLDLQLRKVPFVLLGESGGYNFDYVTSEEIESSGVLARHLLELGHRRIGVVGVLPGNRCTEQRLEGVTRVLERESPEAAKILRRADGEKEDWIPEVCSWFKYPDAPTALITMNNGVALRLYRPLEEVGIEIPRDVSMVSFEDDFWTELIRPSLTTSVPNNAEVARLAFETLRERIKDPEAPPIGHHIPQTFIRRESSGPPRPEQK